MNDDTFRLTVLLVLLVLFVAALAMFIPDRSPRFPHVTCANGQTPSTSYSVDGDGQTIRNIRCGNTP